MTTEQTRGEKIGSAFRTVAGLPERKNDEPVSNDEASGARLATEPEGGYSQGITNSAAINASEHPGGQANGESVTEAEAPKKTAAKKKS